MLVLLVPFVAPPGDGKAARADGASSPAPSASRSSRGGESSAACCSSPGSPPFEGLGVPRPRRAGAAAPRRVRARHGLASPAALRVRHAGAARARGSGDSGVIARRRRPARARRRDLRVPAGARSSPRARRSFLLPLIPVLQVFVPIGEDFAERFLALPIAGAALDRRRPPRRGSRRSASAPRCCVVAACGALVHASRGADYESERALYEDLARDARRRAPRRSRCSRRRSSCPTAARSPRSPRDAERAETLLREAIAGESRARSRADDSRRAARRSSARRAGSRRFPRTSSSCGRTRSASSRTLPHGPRHARPRARRARRAARDLATRARARARDLAARSRGREPPRAHLRRAEGRPEARGRDPRRACARGGRPSGAGSRGSRRSRSATPARSRTAAATSTARARSLPRRLAPPSACRPAGSRTRDRGALLVDDRAGPR